VECLTNNPPQQTVQWDTIPTSDRIPVRSKVDVKHGALALFEGTNKDETCSAVVEEVSIITMKHHY